MSLKRSQDVQGGDERYGMQGDQPRDAADKPTQATAAQMARRKILTTRKPSGNSARSSRAGTPTAPNPFGSQQSMPSFQPPAGGTGIGGDFSFTGNSTTTNNPFAQQNGTPPPTSFQFGQQNGASSGMFGNSSTSFGSTFGGGATQTPQQNGFNPSTSSIFANQNSATAATPSFSFGQSAPAQPQQNGVTPSTATTSSFPSFGKQQNENPFKNFGQSQPATQSTPSTSFGGFGSQQPNGDKPPATPSFGGFGQQPNGEKPSFSSNTDTPKPTTGSIFAGFGQQPQQNGGSKPIETPKPSTGSIFSGLQQNSTSKGLFGSSPPPDQAPQNGGGSVLTGLDSARAKSITPGMFTQSRSNTPNPSSGFSFGQQLDGASASGSGEQETPKPSSSLFSAAQTNGVKTNNFFGSTAASDQQMPAKSSTSNVFNSGQQQQQQSSTPSVFNFGQNQSQSDTSMTTPGNTPQKPSNVFERANSQTAPTASGETPVGQGKSLFDRVSRDEPPGTAQKTTFTPSTSLFGQQGTGTSSTSRENDTPAANQGRSLFDRVSRDEPPVTAQKSQTSFTPSTNLFDQSATKSAETPSAAPWLSHAPATSPPATKVTPPTPQAPSTAKRTTTTSTTMEDTISEAERGTFKLLNEGLMKHMATQNPNLDWTTIMQYYLQQAAKIRKKPEPKFDAPIAAPAPQASAPAPTGGNAAGRSLFTPQTSASQPSSSTTTSSNMFSPSATPKAPAPSTSNMFASANLQQTPKPAQNMQSTPSKAPATAPISRKRPGPFEDDDDHEVGRPPATEKRARLNEPIQYPKLPDNASATAKLFQAALDKPAPEESETASAKPVQVEKASPEKARAETETQATPAPAPAPSFGGFKPSTSTFSGFKPFTSSPSSFKPSTLGSSGFVPPSTTPSPAPPAGMPTFSAPTASSGGFLASFGKKANAEEEKARKKRKDEDYDSEEETEEAWAKRDQEEQEAKRKKILEDGKRATGFVPSATPSEYGDRDSTPESGSVFSFGKSAEADKAADTSSIFKAFAKSAHSEMNKVEPEKEQGSGDITWKPSTPIKFGGNTTGTESTTPAAPPPTFGNFGSLFGSKTQTPGANSSSLLNVPGAKPAIGFNFGVQPFSQGTSRASTPGVTTDGEGASTAGEGDDDEAQPSDPQLEDLTALTPDDKKNNDFIYNLPHATAKRWAEKNDPDTGEMKMAWVTQGEGSFYVLKNKQSGRAWVLLKAGKMGTPKMSFNIEKAVQFQPMGKRGNFVQGLFFDSHDPSNTKIPGRWLIDAETKKNADELLKVLAENRPTS